MKIKYNTAFFLLLALAMGQPSVWAASASSASFSPDTAVMIPPSKKIRVKWAVPPGAKNITLGRWATSSFLVDAKENYWLGWVDGLANSSKAYNLPLDQPVDSFAWLWYGDKGDLLISSKGWLWTLANPAKFDQSAEELLSAQFKPFLKLPVQSAQLLSAGSGNLYLWGLNPKTKRNEVYLLKAHGKGVEVLFSSDGKIGAVSGNTEENFVAQGKLVFKIYTQKKKAMATVVYKDKEPILGLSFSRKAGLFAATKSGITYINEKTNKHAMLVKTPDARMDLKGDTLYVRLSKTKGVLKIEGLAALQKISIP